jgi:hypothetical protein
MEHIIQLMVVFWIIDAKFYDQLINQIKVRFTQIKINEQLDQRETPQNFTIKGVFL